jgi:hypothetical protein
MRSETIGAMAPRAVRKLPIGSWENTRSGIRKAFDPAKGPNDIGIAAEITIARRDAENVAGTLISHRTPDALREESKLLF